MSAKEMFEKLGYKIIESNKEKIKYELIYKIDDYESNEYEIIFDLIAEQIELEYFCDYGSFFGISKKLLQAINKQVEELGWNNEQNII